VNGWTLESNEAQKSLGERGGEGLSAEKGGPPRTQKKNRLPEGRNP